MIDKLDISGVHVKLDKKLEDYARKKIGLLDKFVSPKVKQSLHGEIKLKEGKAKDKRTSTCEVILHLPHSTLTIKESSTTMFAAIDLAEAKLKLQLKKYKDLHSRKRFHHRLLTRLNRS